MCCIPRPSHNPRPHHYNYTWWRVQITKFPLCSFLYPPFTSSHFNPSILLSVLFSNILSLCSSLHDRDQVSHPYRTTSNLGIIAIKTSSGARISMVRWGAMPQAGSSQAQITKRSLDFFFFQFT
jgi:hypothetical protein